MVSAPIEATQQLSERVADWTDDEKHAMLLALLREAVDRNGDRGLIPIEDESGQFFGYFTPRSAAEKQFESFGPEMDDDALREIDLSLKIPNETISSRELLKNLTNELAGLRSA